MRKVCLIALGLVFVCGIALAGGGTKMVNFEGQMMPAVQAKKLAKQGYHRYHDQWLTHNSHMLETEIDCLNLLNSLYLSDVQMRHMVGVGIKMEKARRQYEPQIDAINKEMEAALQQVKKDVVAGKDKMASPGWAKYEEANKKLRPIRKALNHQALICDLCQGDPDAEPKGEVLQL